MEKIAGSGDLMLQEDFMMNILRQLQDQIDTFDEYLTDVFEDKMSKLVSGVVQLQLRPKYPFNHLLAELFYPIKKKNHQTATFCHGLAEEIATTMLIELRDPRKQLQHTYQVQWESTVRQ